ncbi:hypothetical protein BDV19DRAFT_381332 [Aspergillus venezuelensis]
MSPSSVLTLNWETNTYNKQQVDACINRVNWDALLIYASTLNSNKPCTLLEPTTNGGGHLIRLISLHDSDQDSATKHDDKHKEEIWIARIQLTPSTPESSARLRSEINTMNLIRSRSTIATPKIFGYSLSDEDSFNVGAALTLMDFLPGSSAVDAHGGWEAHHGRVPIERRKKFYTDVARIQVQLSSIRLPAIGSVIKNDDGEYGVGPIPSLGGPFNTANELLIASAGYAHDKSLHLRLRELACQGKISNLRYNAGPFPLHHPDPYHSNIIIDDEWAILGIIDWEGAWNMPRTFDDPGKYCVDGVLKDEEGRERVEERGEYVGFVRRMEEELGVDGRLYDILSDVRIQGLAYAVKVSLDSGKMGFYTKVLDGFEK